MKEKRLHMIGNAHIDLVWLWRWQEGMQEVKSTLRSALDRLKEFDGFLFTSSSAAVYEWIERNDPAMFEELRARIAEGRLELCGGWWVQPDCNAPSGESFARQGLYGQRYFQEKFGVTAKTAYNVDSFGHAGILPQIFRKSGMDSYVMMRPMTHERGLPAHLFEWESDDGSRVTAFRILYEYLSWGKELDYHIKRCAAELSENMPNIMCFYGVGNHGGGPTVENIQSIQHAMKKNEDYEILFSTPTRYFSAVKEQGIETLPVVHGELLHHAAGCYSVHSEIKRTNRQSENRLLAAERFSLVAQTLTGLPYPADFTWAWKKMLFNQFHDAMAGTSLLAAYEDARNWAGAALCVADENFNHAIQSLSWNINIPQEADMTPLVVFNPGGQTVISPVGFELYGGETDSFTVLDADGNPVPCQRLSSQVVVNGRCRIGFMAEVPPVGWATYRLYKKPLTDSNLNSAKALTASDTTMENSRFLLEINPETGYITRLYDKKHDYEVFNGDAAVPIVIHDDSDTWSHDVVRFDKQIGAFQAKSVRLKERGAVCATIEVISTYEQSRLVQEFTMYEAFDRIDVKTKIIWNERQKVLKLAFPVSSIFNQYCYETPFGVTERGNTGEEYPMQSWFDATGATSGQGMVYGLSILNDGKSSASIDKNTMLLTLLRSPVYAHHNPALLTEDEEYDVIDQGVQRFSYSLYPHEGKWEQSDLLRHSQCMHQPPFLLPETYHAGSLEQRGSFLQISAPNVLLSALKRAEDGGGTILRLYETYKVSCQAAVDLPYLGRSLSLDFGPNEIKTIYLPDDSAQLPQEVLLTEFPMN